MLNCPYCYEKRQRERHGIYKMPWEDIKSIIDFAKKNKKNNEIIEFSLFGGEPLFYLEDQVFKIIDYLKL
jgi:sulfatase maturation enzyme AslB (radical SAM superfamily)